MQQGHQSSRSPARRRLIAGIVIGMVLLAAGGYFTVGYVAADRLTIPRRNFDAKVAPRQPTIPFRDVRFPSRTDGVSIAGSYIPREGATRAVVMVHGKDNNRKQEFSGQWVDLAMDLQRAGFAVLMIDLRGHGESGDGRFTFGLIERRDVLGALDWLKSQGFQPGRVGVLGVSLGGASSMGAAAEDTGIGAVVLDSTFAEFNRVLEDRWTPESGLPNFFLPSARIGTRILSGVDIGDSNPDADIQRVAPRPVLLIFSTSDDTVLAPHRAAFKAAAPWAEVWEVTGPPHANIYMAYPAEYTRRVVANFDRMTK